MHEYVLNTNQMLLLADVDEYSFANAAYVMIFPIFPIVTNNSYSN